MKTQILKKIRENGAVELETNDNLLVIFFHKNFSGTKKYFFELNAKLIFVCKYEKTALKKIEDFMKKGFTLNEN